MPVKRLLVVILALFFLAGCAEPLQSPTTANVTPASTSNLSAPSTSPSTETSASSLTSTLPTVATTVPVASITALAQGTLEVHFIDVGQGDAILILAPDGKVALIDGGESGSGALAYLKARGIKKVDLMIATHPHADHIGGLIDVLEALPVDEVVTNGQPHTTRTFERFLDAIAAAQATYTEVRRGDSLALGGLTFDVLRPEGPSGEDLNARSIVLRLLYGQVAFLFTGDAGSDAEANMIAGRETVQAQILKVGHHGSRSASSPSFLAAVQPEVAIYSAGAGNSYGHPRPETLAALAEAGAKTYGTDVNGTVIVTSNGTEYAVTTTGEAAPRAPPQQTILAPEAPLTATTGAPAITVASLTSPISPGANARLSVHANPGALCAITVHYKSGPSEAAGLGPQTAGSDGLATWQWKVGTRTTPGVWRIVVTATLNGETGQVEIPFEVRR